MWNPPSQYQNKTNWSEHEDKALLLSFGLTSIEELCEAFMCFPENLLNRARILGIIPHSYQPLTANHIENIIRLCENDTETEIITEIFGLPDYTSQYISVKSGAIQNSNRSLQDYYSRRNDNQFDLFDEE